MIYHIDITSSTNDLAREPQYHHMDVIWAEHQTSGRGQRGHSWHSTEGENITFSVVLTPSFLPVIEQFLLSEIVALALVDTLAYYGIECRIKWTNDIYAKDNKIAGVLIEHSLSGESIARTIVGIGLNINQREFAEWVPNPTSIALLTGKEYNINEVFEKLYDALEARYKMLESEPEKLQSDYHSLLYRRGEEHTYKLPSGEEFSATLEGVKPTGELALRHSSNGELHHYLFKEVEFVIDQRGR
jgi:BirA family biotin operon repressor/biotin-[acetyl-CoA-carboxylase] ligase